MGAYPFARRLNIMAETIFDNRELSWLKFNERVLEEAQDRRVPLLDRLSFTSIFQSNMDEFFMVRVGSLFNKMKTEPKKKDGKSKMTPKKQLNAIFHKVNELEPMKDIAYKNIMLELMDHGVEQVTFRTASVDEQQYLEEYFNKEIKPIINPQIMDNKRSFFFHNKQIYCVLQLQSKKGIKLGVISIDEEYGSRIIRIPTERPNIKRFILLEELILHFAPQVFENDKVIDKTLIRLTRSADIDPDEKTYGHIPDFRYVMEDVCRRRHYLDYVRLQLSETFSQPALKFLCKEFKLDPERTFYLKTPLDLSFVGKVADMCEDPTLRYEKAIPQKSALISDDTSVIEQVKKHDILLSYPYESIDPFIRMLNEAAEDPQVTDIKMTLYRLAKKSSQVKDALCKAAENGKNVFVLVELRARFDEENNIDWSKELKEAGCKLTYGPRDLKVHSKLLLIKRKTSRKTEYITQIGTGNYNEKTSSIYSDLSLITADNEFAEDADKLFDALKNDTLPGENDTKHLLIAPNAMRKPILDMIDEEIERAKKGETAYVGLKVNSVCDKVIMNKIVEASQAGVTVDMVVRGICCLVAGIEGYTDNVTVTSIVGRYLEHSRIYIFGTPDRCKVYISSADIMTRNMIRRIEVAAPVYDEKLKKRITDMFNTLLRDNIKARKQLPDGTYVYKINEETPVNAQQLFINEAYKKADKKSVSRSRTKASNTASQPTAAKKGGRPRKTAEKAEAAKTETKTAETADTKPKRRAGRPKKTAEAPKAAETPKPKRAGRPKKTAEAPKTSETPKRRGRKPKKETE